MDLYPYQEEGVRWLRTRRRAYLADEMGLGKTVQAVVAAAELDACDPGMIHTTVVVCPASVTENWRREWAAWGGPGKLLVISYSKLIRKPKAWLDQLGTVSLCTLDEAHYCKTPSAQRTKAAMKLAAYADRTWLLSGTPVPNDVRELYPVFKALWPDLMPPGVTTAFKWMDHFCMYSENEYGYRVWGNKVAVREELRPALKTFMLRRRLRDVALELPPLRTTVQYLDADPKLDEQLAEVWDGPGDDVPEHLSTLRRVLGEYKAPKVGAILREEMIQDPGQAMVVLYHHRATGAALLDCFGESVVCAGFDGSAPAEQRQAEIDRFQRGEAQAFVAQQGAAGTGITLTRASEIVLVEPAWTPSVNEQAIKRIHRIGQDKPCRARVFAVPGSLDDQLMAAVARKTAMVKEAVDE